MNQVGTLDDYIEQQRGDAHVHRGRGRPTRGSRYMAHRSRQAPADESVPRRHDRPYGRPDRSFRMVSKLYNRPMKAYMVEHVYHKKSFHISKGSVVPTLEVSGLAADIQNHQLNELFSTVGPLVKCKIEYDQLGNSMGMAYVKYQSFDDTQKAYKHFHEAELDGKKLTLRRRYSRRTNAHVDKRIMGVKRKNYFKTKHYDRN